VRGHEGTGPAIFGSYRGGANEAVNARGSVLDSMRPCLVPGCCRRPKTAGSSFEERTKPPERLNMLAFKALRSLGLIRSPTFREESCTDYTSFYPVKPSGAI
jgi:hypothetical protein